MCFDDMGGVQQLTTVALEPARQYERWVSVEVFWRSAHVIALKYAQQVTEVSLDKAPQPHQ